MKMKTAMMWSLEEGLGVASVGKDENKEDDCDDVGVGGSFGEGDVGEDSDSVDVGDDVGIGKSFGVGNRGEDQVSVLTLTPLRITVPSTVFSRFSSVLPLFMLQT